MIAVHADYAEFGESTLDPQPEYYVLDRPPTHHALLLSAQLTAVDVDHFVVGISGGSSLKAKKAQYGQHQLNF